MSSTRIDRACSRFREDSELNAVNRGGRRGGRGEPAAHRGPRGRPARGRHHRWRRRSDRRPRDGRARIRPRLLARGAGPAPASACGSPRCRGGARSGWTAPAAPSRCPAGVPIDLGATAKALAADRAARAIHEATGAGTLVSLGGDIALCGEAPGGGWPVRVTDDHRDIDGEGETISLREGGLATSSTTVRRWGSGDGARHHILDPRRGRAGRGGVAHRQRGGGHLRGRQHRQHGRDRPRRAGPAMARGRRAARAPGLPRGRGRSTSATGRSRSR